MPLLRAYAEQPLHPSHPALPAPATPTAMHAAPAVSTGLRSAPLLPGNPPEGAKIPAVRSPHLMANRGSLSCHFGARGGLASALVSLQESSSSISAGGKRACQEQRPAERSHWRHQIHHSSIVTSISVFFSFCPLFFRGRMRQEHFPKHQSCWVAWSAQRDLCFARSKKVLSGQPVSCKLSCGEQRFWTRKCAPRVWTGVEPLSLPCICQS